LRIGDLETSNLFPTLSSKIEDIYFYKTCPTRKDSQFKHRKKQPRRQITYCPQYPITVTINLKNKSSK